MDSGDLESLLQGWDAKAFTARGKRMWNLVLAAISGFIWLEWNSCTFNSYVETSYRVLQKVEESVCFGL